MQEALFAGHRGKGVVDTCLQIELAVFLLQAFGDEDDVDTGEALVQESDVLAVLLRGTFFVKNGCVVPFAMTFAALLQDETAMNMPPAILLKWSMVTRLLPM